MAEAAESVVDCLLCLEKTSEEIPLITLGCEHCFCSPCLRQLWAPSLSGDCPKCRRRWSKLLLPTFALEGESGVSGEEASGGTQTELSPGSGSGQSAPLQDSVSRLKQRKERSEEVLRQYKSMLELTDRQTEHCEAQIRDGFRRFHDFLLQEEELQLSELRQEREEKTQIIKEELKKLEEEVCSVSDRISSAEEQGHSTDSSSLSEHMESLLLTGEPELRSGLLIDQARVLGNLSHRVHEKMWTVVTWTPVILDPNTAHEKLRLSEDLLSVRHEDTLPQLPPNPERFTKHLSVLGSEELSSGLNQWAVEVRDHPDWAIGVARGSVDRRSESGLLPEEGFYCLKYRNKEYTDVNDEKLQLRWRPERISVTCRHDRFLGIMNITFDNISDKSLICSYQGDFTEEIFPFFSIGKDGDADDKNLKIYKAELQTPGATPFRHYLKQLEDENKSLRAENTRLQQEKERLLFYKASLDFDKSDPRSPHYERTESSLATKSASGPGTSQKPKKKPESILQRLRLDLITKPESPGAGRSEQTDDY